MQQLQIVILTILLGISCLSNAQDQSDEYLVFDDRSNVVHGVYLGISGHYGQIDDKDTYIGGLKVAYVANQQFEVGFSGSFMYSDQDYSSNSIVRNDDLFVGYGGLHLEPIFFGKSKVSLSFPLLIGAGGAGYIEDDFNDSFGEDLTYDDFDPFFVVEPGISALFNISRHLQIEAGLKYRLTSKVSLRPNGISNLKGFSAGVGIKVGIFNMGRNRYKKNI